MRQEEHDACGVGFLADLSNKASHRIVELALAVTERDVQAIKDMSIIFV